MKQFDLNIERILENWEVKHAIREIISNAIDETILSNCDDIQIFKDSSNRWHIRDYGRGLKYEHFTQKENEEKLSHETIIGKFGVGLKDALATFDRKGINVEISTRHSNITIGKSSKNGFEDLITLHAFINPPLDTPFKGTDFILKGVLDNDITQAMQMFLRFNKEKVMDQTRLGAILQKESSLGKIYINGVLVANEENFLFSYNITSLNASIKKALNRERSNVGRTAYASAVKSILLESNSKDVADLLVHDLQQFSSGSSHDELKWIDVQQHAANILNKYEKVVFVTSEEIERGVDLIEEARKGSFQVVAIPSNLREKLVEQNKIESERQISDPNAKVELVRTFSQFIQERSENFEFKFIDESELNSNELEIWKSKDMIMELLNIEKGIIENIVISETMQKDDYTFRPARGLWMSKEKKVIIKRSELNSYSQFIGVFMHECAHAISGAPDATRKFESELTRMLGELGAKLLR